MTTGEAFTGSSTPPICAAALRCTRSPTWAHEPTSACESTIVPSPTCAPTFTYIGGMHTTPAARYAPRRTADPPGTIRTPCPAARVRGGHVGDGDLTAEVQRRRSIVCSGLLIKR